MSFADKVVIVTGSSSGIGAAAAIAFAKEGAHVTIVGRKEDKLKDVGEKCAAVGPQPLVLKADVSNEDDAKRIIQNTVDKFGKIDVLVNNAGVARFGVISDASIMQTYDCIMNINLRSMVHLTTLATPHLIETKGNIVNMSSVGGIAATGAPFLAYSVANAALNHFTRGAALELAPSGIRVNVICPGPVRTDIMKNADAASTWDEFAADTALGRFSEPEEISDLILFLASDKAKGITGSIYVSDNGLLLKSIQFNSI